MSRYIVSSHEQRTAGWYADRAGRGNGSEIAAIFSTIKSGEAAARRDLRLKLVLERITGKPQQSGFVNAEMQRGIDFEPTNRLAFETATGLLVEEVGYCYLPDVMAGCSPDGLVEEDGQSGFVEFKCPKSNTHLGYLREQGIPSEYAPQIVHTFWVLGADFCYFQSWDDRFPDEMQVFRKRVTRAEVDIESHAKAVLAFLAEVDRDEAALRKEFKLEAS